MSRKLIYITLPTLVEAIEDVLATHPYCLYQDSFIIPELRQKLIVYTLKQIRAQYTVLIDDTQTSFNCPNSLSQQWLQMKDIIQQSIYHLQQNCVWDSSYQDWQMRDRVNEAELTEKNDEIDG